MLDTASRQYAGTPYLSQGVPDGPQGHVARLKLFGERVQAVLSQRGTSGPAGIPRILDAGCGTGQLLTIPLGQLGIPVLGIDTDAPSIEHAKKLNPFPNVTFENRTVESLRGQQFDLVFCCGVLMYVSDPAAFLKDLKVLLGPCGLMFLTVSNRWGSMERELQLCGAASAIGGFFRRGNGALADPDAASSHSPASGAGEWLVRLRDSLFTPWPFSQSFSVGRMRRLLRACGMEILEEHGLRIAGGPLSDKLLMRSKKLIDWNTSFARFWPLRLASTLVFILGHQH